MALQASRDEANYEEVAEKLENLLKLLDTADSEVGTRDFFVSVRASAEDMLTRVTEHQRASARQERTVDNWTNAVNNWLD